MSLVKKHEMTEKKLESNRRNQKLCHTPAADERRERVRAALRRFGYNVQAEEIVMRGLGEDPADFQFLLRTKRYERQMEALKKTTAFQDVLETKGVSNLAPECPETLSHSNENG